MADVKTVTLTKISESDNYSNLLQRHVFTDEATPLPGYKPIWNTNTYEVHIPDFIPLYLEEDLEYIYKNAITDTVEIQEEFNQKPELFSYFTYDDEVKYLFDMLYVNKVFSRIDFSTDNISTIKVIDTNVIDNMRSDLYNLIDQDTKQVSYATHSPMVMDRRTIDEYSSFLQDEEFIPDFDDTTTFSERTIKLILKRFSSNYHNVVLRNLTIPAICNRLSDEIGEQRLYEMLSRVAKFEKDLEST